jgi:hypothetical protein
MEFKDLGNSNLPLQTREEISLFKVQGVLGIGVKPALN